MRTKIFASLLLLLSIHAFSQNVTAGKEFINYMLAGDYTKCYQYLDDDIKNDLPINQLSDIVKQVEADLGQFKKIISVTDSAEVIYYYSEFEKAKLDIQVSFNTSSKVVGFFFVPHKEDQQANDANNYTIQGSDHKLEGTLLIPEKNIDKKKLVIFLAGSGPQDRDESLYENKPFKDVAEGLKKLGIASYRFDKSTFRNPEKFGTKSTIDDEYTYDALSAVSFFTGSPEFKEYQIILLGHSLGGHIAPKVFNEAKNISKMIFMAANASPLTDLIISQYDYICKLNPDDENLKKESAKVKEQVLILHSEKFNERTPQEDLLLGQSYYYWKSLLDYNLLLEVERINVPILVLQGEKDYQVTMKDFALWKKHIKSKGSKFISYPKLNHIFMTGSEKSTPDDYMQKGIVDEKVIQDISGFILKN